MSYTKVTHSAIYPSISPAHPALSMRGKTIFITGGGAGLGKLAAHAFAEAGARAVALLGRRSEPLAAVAQAIRVSHPDTEVLTFAVDILQAADVRAAVAAAGPLDVVVHCAGALGSVGPLATTDEAGLWAAFEANVRGTLVVMQSILPHLVSHGGVFIPLNTGAVVFPPMPGMGSYTASKAGLLKMVECFAAENPSVRVMNVHPGMVRTDMSEELERQGIVFPYDECDCLSGFKDRR